jgi:hypothetical protein
VLAVATAVEEAGGFVCGSNLDFVEEGLRVPALLAFCLCFVDEIHFGIRDDKRVHVKRG